MKSSAALKISSSTFQKLLALSRTGGAITLTPTLDLLRPERKPMMRSRSLRRQTQNQELPRFKSFRPLHQSICPRSPRGKLKTPRRQITSAQMQQTQRCKKMALHLSVRPSSPLSSLRLKALPLCAMSICHHQSLRNHRLRISTLILKLHPEHQPPRHPYATTPIDFEAHRKRHIGRPLACILVVSVGTVGSASWLGHSFSSHTRQYFGAL